MITEPAHALSASLPEGQKKNLRSDRSEDTIEACYELISSGQPLSEILLALKRLGPLNENSSSERGLKPSETQITDIVRELPAPEPRWEGVQLTQSLELRLLPVPARDSSNSLVALRVGLPRESARGENWTGIMLPRLIGSILFWLIPVLSMVIIGVGGKFLSDASGRWKIVQLTAVPAEIRHTVESTEETTAPQAEEADPTQVPAISEILSGTRPEMRQKRSPAPTPALVRGPRRSAQPRYTPLHRPPPMSWRIPDRLTDGF